MLYFQLNILITLTNKLLKIKNTPDRGGQDYLSTQINIPAVGIYGILINLIAFYTAGARCA